ncbi:MAG: cell division protein FtsX [Chitinivibrionales bacterium]
MRNIFYFIKEAFRGFLNAQLMTFISVTIIAASLLLLSLIGIGLYNVHKFLEDSGRNPEMIVFLFDAHSSDPDFRESFIEDIYSHNMIDSVAYVSKEQAWERFEDKSPELLKAVEENPFPASFEIRLKPGRGDPEKLRERVEKKEGVEGVNYSGRIVERLEKINRLSMLISVVIIPLLILSLFAIIANSIKMTIFARQELIENMKYVGATDFYINTPFVIEGVLQGLLGACLAIAAIAVVKFFTFGIEVHWGGSISYLIILFFGVFFGWTGSLWAVYRFRS